MIKINLNKGFVYNEYQQLENVGVYADYSALRWKND
jgi:hypothetical protein